MVNRNVWMQEKSVSGFTVMFNGVGSCENVMGVFSQLGELQPLYLLLSAQADHYLKHLGLVC
jgi:hypothetical protein